MNHQDISEIVAGLVLRNKLSPSAVDAELLMPPYDEIIAKAKAGKPIERIIADCGVSSVSSAHAAADTVMSDSIKLDWLEVLRIAYTRTTAGSQLYKLAKKLQMGEEVDITKLRGTIEKLSDGMKTGRVRYDDIEDIESVLIPSGNEAIDYHTGGFPKSGLIVIAGKSGVGKTTLVVSFVSPFLKVHPGETAVIYSLEMTGQEIKKRIREINEGDPAEDIRSRIQINADPMDVHELVADAALVDNLGLVIVDYADYLVRGKVEEASMAEIYYTLSIAAKELDCPIILLAQFNKTYQKGLPRPYHIRYTAVAEHAASMLITLYDPNADEASDDEENTLPRKPGHAYIAFWKIRAGFLKHPNERPGAIMMKFDGRLGWTGDRTSKWFKIGE